MSFLKTLFGKSEKPAIEVAKAADEAPKSPSTEGVDHALVLERARNELGLRTGLHDSAWGIGSAAWAVDLQEGLITFTSQDGRRIVAPVEVVGTLDTTKGTFMWGWDHPSVPEPLGRAAAAVRDYGETRGLDRLTTRVIECDETEAWDFAALACHLSGAQGAYRGPVGPTLVFMTFGTVTMSKPGATMAD